MWYSKSGVFVSARWRSPSVRVYNWEITAVSVRTTTENSTCRARFSQSPRMMLCTNCTTSSIILRLLENLSQHSIIQSDMLGFLIVPEWCHVQIVPWLASFWGSQKTSHNIPLLRRQAFVDPYSWGGQEKGKKEDFLKPASPQFKAQWSSTPFTPLAASSDPIVPLLGPPMHAANWMAGPTSSSAVYGLWCSSIHHSML